MFCRFVPKLITHKDICELSDDGNPGAFNVFKHCGAKVGCLCLFLDALKGFAPVILASFFTDTSSFLFAFVMLAPVLGHAAGVFNKFHGGKCIAVSFGVMFGLIPVTYWGIVLLAALYILFSTVAKIKSNRVRSIVVFALFAVACAVIMNIFGLYSAAFGCGLISATAIIKHVVPSRAYGSELNDTELTEIRGNDK